MAYYTTEHANSSVRIAAGTTAGLIGGIFMGAFLMLYHQFVTEMGWWVWANQISTIAGFPSGTEFGVNTLVGVVVHLMTAAVFGMILGLALVRKPGALMAIVSGLIYGMIIFGLMYYILLPMLQPSLAQAGQNLYMLIAHLLYGLGFVFYPAMLDRYNHR